MKRLRDLGLLLLFVLLYVAFIAAVVALGGGGSVTGSGAVMLIGAVAIAWLLLTRIERRPFGDLGLGWSARSMREWLVGLALPCAALVLVTLVLTWFGHVRYFTDDGSLWDWVIGCGQLLLVLAVPAAAEEALFRGYPFQKLVSALGPIAATLLASGGFALAHRHNPNVNTFALLNIFLAGVMLSVAYLRTRSLWFPIALHIGWNWIMAGPLDLPVSGLELFDAPLYEPRTRGAEWVSGGSFGPEGGVAGLVALLLVTAAVLVTTKRMHTDA